LALERVHPETAFLFVEGRCFRVIPPDHFISNNLESVKREEEGTVCERAVASRDVVPKKPEASAVKT
jgi:hypothetical protein